MALFAVHLLDGFLPYSWCAVGYVGAVALAALGCWRLHERDIPRIALATAAFFVASSIHIKIPPSSVHLVLNGLVGVMLGYRAGLALFVGLFLQAVLIGHGGISTLGINDVLQTLPALTIGAAFQWLAASKRISIHILSLCSGFLGAAGVLATVVLQSGLLWLAEDNGPMSALLWFALHVPVAVVEGIVVGFMVHYLTRVKPELLGLRAWPSGEELMHLRQATASAANEAEFANSSIVADKNAIK